MNLVREPDAGNPPVRFDEREVETEHGMRLVRHRRGNPDPEYAEAYPTAPPLDSTLFVRDKWVTVPYSGGDFCSGLLEPAVMFHDVDRIPDLSRTSDRPKSDADAHVAIARTFVIAAQS